MRTITKSELIFLIEDGLSSYQIADIFGRGQTSVRYWLNLYDLKTNGKKGGFSSEMSKRINRNRGYKLIEDQDWKRIQFDYDSGINRSKLKRLHNISERMLINGTRLGYLKLRTKQERELLVSKKNMNKRHSEESKKKLSEIRKAYLSREIKPAWKTHEKFKSQPCEWLKSELEKCGYKFTPELSPLKHKGKFYSVDIAFPEQKFIIEINGRQHYNSDGTLTPYYQIRHDLISADGWDIWEVSYSTTRNIGFLDSVFERLKQKNIYPKE